MRLTIFLLIFALPLYADDPKKEDKAKDPPREVTKTDKVTIDGKVINYRAKASLLTLKSDDNKDRANIFNITYEKLGQADRHKRPVLFAFNGGPGSSAVWLHLGALGPKITPTSEDGTKTLPPPNAVIENPYSILDVADLVFIDPVSTGFSRAAGDTKAKDFHGLNEDIRSVADFIRRWTTENDRWASPKYLLGESYGGIRAAGVVDELQSNHGMTMNGVVLLSALLDFRTLDDGQSDDLSKAIFLPALAATAHHHGKITGDRDQLVKEARAFAFSDYYQALLKGASISSDEKSEIAQQLSRFTSLPAELFERNQLRLSESRFRRELLKDQDQVLGRFDARVSWPTSNRSENWPGYDPSYQVVYGAFATAMNDYLSRDLGWEGHHPYRVLTHKVRPWKWSSENAVVNLSNRLQNAMIENPDLRLLVMMGHTDLATPPANMQYSLDHFLHIPQERRKSIELAWYEAGHMFYLNQPDLQKMRKDLVNFLKI